MKFSKEDFVVVAHGSKGTLSRQAKVTDDFKYAKYFGSKFVSVALIKGEVFRKSDFIQSLAENQTLSVVRSQNAITHHGILHGDRSKMYKTLVYPLGDSFQLLDLEENPPPQSSHMRVRIIEPDIAAQNEAKVKLLNLFK